MPLDPSIPLQLRPIQMANPLEQAGNVLALQGGMQRNALGQMQMRQMERQMADEEAVRNVLSQNSDINEAPNALMRRGLIKPAMEIQSKLLERRKAEATIAKDEAETGIKHLTVLSGIFAPLASKPNVSTEDIVSAITTAKAAGVPETVLKNIAAQVPANAQLLPKFVQGVAFTTEHGLKTLQAVLPKAEKVDNGSQIGFVNTNPLAGVVGQQVAGSPTIAKTATPGDVLQANTTMRGQNMVDARMRQQNANAIDPTIQGNLAAAREEAQTRAKAKVGAEFSLPGAKASMDRAITQVDELLKHPGFESTVGATLAPGARFVPGTKQADFQARFDQIKGGAFLEAYNVLKGGGQITEIEGRKATDAINRMSLAQSEKEFKTAAQDFKNAVRSGYQKIEAQASGKPGASSGGWSIQRVD